MTARPHLTVTQLAEVARVRALCTTGVAARIRHLAGLTTHEIATTIGTSHESVRRWETGRTRPNPHAALRYGDALDRIWYAIGHGKPMAVLHPSSGVQDGPAQFPEYWAAAS